MFSEQCDYLAQEEAFTIRWYIQGKVTLIQYQNNVTLHDVETVMTICYQLLEETEQVIHSIIELPKGKPTFNVTELARLEIAKKLYTHPHSGWVIYVTDSKVAAFLASVVSQMSKARIRFVVTINEGLDFINEIQ